MPALLDLARSVEKIVPLRLVALAGSMLMRLRGDKRRFQVDRDGHWVNQQPDAGFVSPDLHTAHKQQIVETVSSYWFHDYSPQAGDVVVDVGAGIGEDAVVLSDLVGPTGAVHAIEAHPDVYQCLVSTASRSRLGNVECHHLAITEQDGDVTISNDTHHLANSIIGTSDGIKVPALSLDHFFEREKLNRIDLLKMNIEGAERGAMIGLEKHADRVRNVAISCHDFIADGGGGDQFRTKDHVRQRLLDLGFVITERRDATTAWEADVLFGRRI